ncbi:CRISPR-associated exonuclease, Cas4 family [Desulfonatronum thiosulfatophilum]|uniref:CRISPR-associated exonuclease Cas4 n=1 Tax=Desulfonatronum thiosulfatophilum TaxID=617002 RepID=A0A1G6EVL4_9BACT|nr:CRISPR-associated protein Cas4 [Desulfonatronum thiosulfatophilum]SDB61312.1 CRISPR-associated exonuclease, Cas4 family [Desulfonatronum thiosulfatophilum]
MYTEADLLPLSALQHLLFCPRQCALIHIEQVWTENRFTAEGRVMHERVDSRQRETRGKVRIETGVPLRSLSLGISGRADLVEYHLKGQEWVPFPVEYKRGRPKKDSCDAVQLCAQALCLEEMLDRQVPEGALFYGQNRRRRDVAIDEKLRRETMDAAAHLHDLIRSGITPPARYEKKCDSCSLLELCLPKVAGSAKNVQRYLSRILVEPT